MRLMAQILSLLIGCSCYAQEIPLLPADQHTIPDTVVYRILMHHAAAFDQKARELEAKGLDGTPYRKHLEQKLGLSPSQVQILMNIAREYSASTQRYEQQIQAVLTQFSHDHAPGGALPPGERPPSPPAALVTIHQLRDSSTLAARDKFKTAIGDAEFARVDTALRAAFHLPNRSVAP
jgi:hypothetical protein